jgi:ribonuclease HII
VRVGMEVHEFHSLLGCGTLVHTGRLYPASPLWVERSDNECYASSMPGSTRWVIGIDEVGRGPLAGPVAVGAVLAPEFLIRKIGRVPDSKALSSRMREEWGRRMDSLRGEGLRVEIAMVEARTIDRIGIVAAIRLALRRAIDRLGADPAAVRVLLDGGLRAPRKYVHQATIVRGDEQETIIALASIAAKVRRDHVMEQVAVRFPGYGFSANKGYGSAEHIAAIRMLGLSPVHRQSFCRGMTPGVPCG